MTGNFGVSLVRTTAPAVRPRSCAPTAVSTTAPPC